MIINAHRTFTFLHLIMLGLAAWRMSSLVANELGPFYMFAWIRFGASVLEENWRPAQKFHLTELLNCEWCSSVWFGFGLTLLWLWLGDMFIILFVLPLAISAIAIIVKYLVHYLQRDHVSEDTYDTYDTDDTGENIADNEYLGKEVEPNAL